MEMKISSEAFREGHHTPFYGTEKNISSLLQQFARAHLSKLMVKFSLL